MGIRRQLTVPYTPQPNECVKRFNRTLLNMGHEMNKAFWAEAISCAAYFWNRSLKMALEGVTPYEV